MKKTTTFSTLPPYLGHLCLFFFLLNTFTSLATPLSETSNATAIVSLSPTITCPPDITVSQSILPDFTGYPTTTEPSSVDTIYYVDFNDDICGDDEIERNWIVTDNLGNNDTCIQILTLPNDINDILLPADTMIISCNGLESATFENTGAPMIYGVPLSAEEYVFSYIITYEDYVISATQCSRQFSVVDWCNPSQGAVYLGEQLITKDISTCPFMIAYSPSGDNTSTVFQMDVCNGASSSSSILFTDDGANDGNYSDAHARIDTIEICPTDQNHYVQVGFTTFDIEDQDQLEVYQGDLAAVSLGLPVHQVATGVGVSNAFGGWMYADCNSASNPSGCLTFILRTDGNNTKGSGWEANVGCATRAIELQDVTIPDVRLSCQDDPFSDVTIPTPVVAACDVPLTDANGRILYEIKNAEGTIVKSDTITSGTSILNIFAFAIGQYTVTYTALIDNSKTLIKQFSVQAPSLVCNDEITKTLGANCEITLTPNDILETVCPTSTYLKYNISVTLGTGATQKTIGPTITIADLEEAGVPLCGGSATVNIERIYFEDGVPAIVGDCHNGPQVTYCETNATLQDLSKLILNIPTEITEVVACDETDLADILRAIVTDNCDTDIDFTTSIVLAENGPCFGEDGRVTATVRFTATDDCGNSSSEDRIFTIIRPTIVEKVDDVVIDCGAATTIPVPAMSVGYMDGTTFVRTDSVQLAVDDSVCGYVLSYTEVVIPATDCGSKLYRYYDLLDWCAPANGPQRVDTVFVEYTDESAPVLASGAETIGAVNIPLDAFDCTYDINNFTVPVATDNCDSNPTEYLAEVSLMEDGNPLPVDEATWSELMCGTYRLTWVAEDNCHEQLINDTVTQIVVIQDVTAPSAVTVDELNVSVPNDEGALVSVGAIDGGSSDDCGISTREVRRMNPDGSYSAWGAGVFITCEDVHEEVTVELRITDNKDNVDIAWTTIKAEDKIRPVCDALDDKILTCNDFYIGELGSSTDTDGDRKFEDSEWTDVTAELQATYNEYFGAFVCKDNLDGPECGSLTTKEQYQLIQWPCGEIEMKRRHQAYDWSGNESNWAKQDIKVEYAAGWSFTLPDDATGSCDNLPTGGGIAIDNGACDLLGYEVTSKLFEVPGDACFKMERTYHIINWCKYTAGQAPVQIARTEGEHGHAEGKTITYEGNEDAGYWTYVQILKVHDDEGPVVTIVDPESCINGVEFDAAPYGEEDQSFGVAPYKCDELKTWTASATDCSDQSAITWVARLKDANGNVVHETNTNSISIVVTNESTYTAEFWAYDDCGNSGGKSGEVITFWDCKKPTPYVLNGIAIDLGQDGTVEVWANDLDQGSFDNCTDQADLEMYIAIGELTDIVSTVEEIRTLGSYVEFTCDHIGRTNVLIYVVDGAGYWDVVGTYVSVGGNAAGCANPDGIMVAGHIVTPSGENVEQVSVSITGAMQESMTTTADGTFQFELNTGADYTVTPVKDMNPLNGVSTFDLVLISKHILGHQAFDSPYKYIAADVNKSGTITAFDMVQLRQLILNIKTEFQNNDSWRFVDAKHEFTSENPAGENFDEFMNINNLNGEMLDVDFIATKIGDVNGNAQANSFKNDKKTTIAKARFSPVNISIDELEIPIENIPDTFNIPVRASNFTDILGIEFNLSFDSSSVEFLEIENLANMGGYFGTTQAENGKIAYLWHDTLANSISLPDNTILFELKCRMINSASTFVQFDTSKRQPLIVYENLTESLPIFKDGKIQVDSTNYSSCCRQDTTLISSTSSTQVFFNLPTVSRFCDYMLINSSHQPGDYFPFGTTVVTYLAIDTLSKDMVSCSFKVIIDEFSYSCPPTEVTINQSILPEFTGIPEINTPDLFDSYSYQDSVATDPCDDLQLVRTWTILDIHGNSYMCQQNLSKVIEQGLLTINGDASNNNYIPSNIYQTTNNIISDGVVPVSNDVTFIAGESITLNVGFHTQAGGDFWAKIEDGCVSAQSKQTIPAIVISPISANDLEKISFSADPNPFQNSTKLSFQLPSEDKVTMLIFDQSGRMVKQLLPLQLLAKGAHEVTLLSEGLNGVFFYAVLQTSKERIAKKIVLLKN